MSQALTVQIPDETYQALLRLAEEAGWTPERWATECLIADVHRIDNDPLLKLAGCIDVDLGDAVEKHDYWFGHTMTEEEERESLSRDG
jgi:predicted transcriptional regulator